MHNELDETTRDLVKRLKAVRQANPSIPPDELRSRLSSALQEMLASLPRDRAQQAIENVRAALVDEARNRQERMDALEREVAALAGERDSLKASLAQRPTSAEPSVPPGKDRGVERIRRALHVLADDGGVSQATTSLGPEDLQLLQVVEALYRFALGVTSGSERFLAGASPTAGGTVVAALGREVRDTFRACADAKPGSLKDLEHLLERARLFLPAVINAYTAAVRSGVEDMLKVLDPQVMAEKHRRRAGLGTNYEEAWKTFTNSFEELQGMTSTEIWERFFQEKFHAELKQGTEGKTSERRQSP